MDTDGHGFYRKKIGGGKGLHVDLPLLGLTWLERACRCGRRRQKRFGLVASVTHALVKTSLLVAYYWVRTLQAGLHESLRPNEPETPVHPTRTGNDQPRTKVPSKERRR